MLYNNFRFFIFIFTTHYFLVFLNVFIEDTFAVVLCASFEYKEFEDKTCMIKLCF